MSTTIDTCNDQPTTFYDRYQSICRADEVLDNVNRTLQELAEQEGEAARREASGTTGVAL